MNVRTGWLKRATLDHSYFSFLAFFAAILFSNDSRAQCQVISTTGYTVKVHVVPIELVRPATCVWGYNYNVRLAYDIEFVGNNVPNTLYTLQGNLFCGNQSLFFNLPKTAGSGVVTTSSNPWRSQTDCAVAQLNTLACFTVQVQISGPGISNRVMNCAFSPLPVELVSFHAVEERGNVMVNWSTASEQNSDRFVLERSQNGVFFEEISTVPAAGSSSTYLHYSYVDYAPLVGTSFYRLRQWDLDGTQSESPITAVHVKREGAEIKVYPNPGTGREIQLYGAAPGSSVSLFSPTQALIYESSITGLSLSIPELAPGVYTGVVTSPMGLRSVFRYVRQ